MRFKEWRRSGWLQPFEATVAEIQKGFQVVDREISDAQVNRLSADGRFQHAYDASLQLTIIALKASGYVVKKGQGHQNHSIGSLRYTLGAPWSATADHIERCSRLKRLIVYEEIGVVSEEEATDLLDAVKQLRSDVIDWFKTNRRDLLPRGL